MSDVSEITEKPDASIFFISDFTKLNSISMSCIIKSNTTETSVPLGLNSANLWASINSGESIEDFITSKAGLYLST